MHLREFCVRPALAAILIFSTSSAFAARAVLSNNDDDNIGQSRASAYGYEPPRDRYSGFGLGFETGYFHYKEPGLMEDTGLLSGIKATYVKTFDQAPVRLRAESDLLAGLIDYDGETWSGDKLNDTMTDKIFNLRTFGGYLIEMNRMTFVPELGLAYRYLNDDGSSSSSYEREISYLYAPVAFEWLYDYNDRVRWGVRGEYDYFISGTVKTHLSDYDPKLPDLTNSQSQGFGSRVSGSMEVRFTSVSFRVEPYWQHWEIGASDVQSISAGQTGEEPANRSDQYG